MPDTKGLRLRRPGAGREPAASALLGWLADARAPRLCVLTGPSNAGKSHLLAWLVEHGDTPSEDTGDRRVHAVAPLAGVGLRGAVWLAADHLGLAARAPGELCTAVAEDKRRTVLVLCDLHHSRAPDAIVDQLIRPLLRCGHVKLVVESRTGAPCTDQLLGHVRQSAVMDLGRPRWTDHDGFRRWALAVDPAAEPERLYPLPGLLVRPEQQPATPPDDDLLPFTAESVVRADPHAVTAWLDQRPTTAERASDLGRAWLRAGQSLCAADAASTRALTLLAALDSNAAADVRRPLHDMARPEPWRVVHTSTREGTGSGWPGPVTALCAGAARHAGQVLCAGHLGDVRLLDRADSTVTGRLTSSRNRPAAAVLCLTDGTVVAVDDFGGVSLVGEAPRNREGLQALLEPDTDRWTQLRQAALTLPERMAAATLTTAASLPDGAAFGDSSGHVHALSLKGDDVEPTSRMLHDGPVTALAGLALEGAGPALLYSGGVDGRVRVWSPGAPPMPEPLLHRPSSVVDLSASTGEGHSAELAVAWADGLVQYVDLVGGVTLPFRPGPPVRAVCCVRTGTGEPRIVIGMDDCVTTLVPHPRPAHDDH
ncbi:hypothetical protein ACIGW0_12110 [Streptomyces bikiniensis]|uniref:Uncharacterized protein n=1 Tax=Streptomyces bikiniensis TaxID=1896 RepID=A0ABW8CUM6_STRBI